MRHEISEKEENTEKQNTGKIMVLENKECPICRTFVSQVFVTCARACHTHTHTIHGWKGVFDILRLDHTVFQGVFMKPLLLPHQRVCVVGHLLHLHVGI